MLRVLLVSVEQTYAKLSQDMVQIWYGVEFVDGTLGKHNGTVNGKRYFLGADLRCNMIKRSYIRTKLTSSQTPQSQSQIESKLQSSMLLSSTSSGHGSDISFRFQETSDEDIIENNHFQKTSKSPSKSNEWMEVMLNSKIEDSNTTNLKNKSTTTLTENTKHQLLMDTIAQHKKTLSMLSKNNDIFQKKKKKYTCEKS